MSEFLLSRRTVLKGLGTAVALPWLESLPVHAQEAAGPALRMAFVYVPNGVNLPLWRLKDPGPLGELTPTLKPLEEFRKHLVVLSGLTQDHARPKADGAGDHARASAVFLTGARPVKTDGKDLRVGASVDQIAAAHVGHRTALPSIELGLDPGALAGNCDSGYGCAYSSNISWRTPSTPAPKLSRPREVFERLFGDPSLSRQERRRRAKSDASILDFVRAEARALRGRLAVPDRAKLDEYLDSVRAVELRIAAVESQPTLQVDPPAEPATAVEKVRVMIDLLVLAFRTDVTRIGTLMLGNEGSERTHPHLEVRDGHHTLSHHGNDAAKLAQIGAIDRYHVEQFAYLLGELAKIREGERSLLESSMIVYGSGIADGNAHDHGNLPVLLAGGGGGTISGGRHLVHPAETPLNNLYLSMLDRMGVRLSSFGDSTGRLVGLEG